MYCCLYHLYVFVGLCMLIEYFKGGGRMLKKILDFFKKFWWVILTIVSFLFGFLLTRKSYKSDIIKEKEKENKEIDKAIETIDKELDKLKKKQDKLKKEENEIEENKDNNFNNTSDAVNFLNEFFRRKNK